MTDRAGAPRSAAFTFLAVSSLGAAFMLLPVPYEGVLTIPLGIVASVIQRWAAPALPTIVLLICVVSAVATLAYSLLAKRRGAGHPAEVLLRPGVTWIVIRVLGAVTALMIWAELGPAWLASEEIGGLALNDLAVTILVTIGVACAVLPFLTEFGLMEFIGTLVERSFRRLFTVPGRSAVDAVASWLGGSSVGVVVTTGQYEAGHYSAREASVIATNFSIVSIAFAYVIVETVGLESLFFPFYAVLVLSGIICAIILPRIPPLSRKHDSFLVDNQERQVVQTAFSVQRAWQSALARAKRSPNPGQLTRMIVINILDIWLGLIPAVILIATFSLAVAELTPLFDWISWPFVWLLKALQVESAREAAPAMVIGFADMFLPALLVADIPSEETRFLVSVVAVGQLIFMSEVGILILKSSLPLSVIDLIQIFFLRTLIILPIAKLGALLVFTGG
ncbi:MAG: YjiH family protein [Pseudomonadota bacterium]